MIVSWDYWAMRNLFHLKPMHDRKPEKKNNPVRDCSFAVWSFSTVTHLQLLAVPLAKLWTVVYCDVGIHFTCCLHASDPEHAICTAMHLVCHFASTS